MAKKQNALTQPETTADLERTIVDLQQRRAALGRAANHPVNPLGQLGANILGVEHRRLFLDVPAKGAKLDVTVETRDRTHGEQIFKVLKSEGFQPVWIDTATMME